MAAKCLTDNVAVTHAIAQAGLVEGTRLGVYVSNKAILACPVHRKKYND